MAGKRTIKIASPYHRRQAVDAVIGAPDGYVVTVAEPTRTSEQNRKFHAMLRDIMRAKPEGRDLPWDVWRSLLMAEAGFKPRFEPSLDGQGVVPIGFSSSRLKKAEFADLITATYAYGDMHGVVWSEPNPYE